MFLVAVAAAFSAAATAAAAALLELKALHRWLMPDAARAAKVESGIGVG